MSGAQWVDWDDRDVPDLSDLVESHTIYVTLDGGREIRAVVDELNGDCCVRSAVEWSATADDWVAVELSEYERDVVRAEARWF